MNKAQIASMAWEAAAIEKCRNDPEFMAKGLCPVCVCTPPCICDRNHATTEMRSYYESARRVERYTIFGNVRIERPELSRAGSWGSQIDVLMQELYKIATKRHVEEIHALRGKPADKTDAQ